MIEENKEFLLYSTAGASMFPFIRLNEQILVKRTDPKKMAVGDIILFESDKRFKVCHRIVKIENNDSSPWFQTKGDRNRFYDMPIREESILGKVIAIKRKMNLIGLSTKKRGSLLYKFDCLFVYSLFVIKKSPGLFMRIINFNAHKNQGL